MKRKNMIAAVLAAVMAVSAMTGCGEQENTTNNGTVESSEVKQESSVEATPEPEILAEPTKLTLWSDFTGVPMVSGPDELPYYQAIEEACNVEFEFVDSSGGKDTLSLMTGSNTLPDLVLTNSSNISGGIDSLVIAGLIVPLNDLMEKGWMPNLRAYLDSDPEVDNLSKNDDGIYAWAPMIRAKDSVVDFTGYMVRKDWLDELKLEVPSSIEKMEEVLLAFKEKKGAETGLEFQFNNTQWLAASWGIVEGMYVDNGTVKYGYLEDAYKDYLETANRWINLGILDPDAFAQDNETFWAKVATGKTGMILGFTGSGFTGIEKLKGEVPEMQYIPMEWPALKEGEDFLVECSDLRVSNYGIFMSATCEEQEAAARVIDYMYSEEGTMLANFGIEGVSYEMVDGKPVYTELITNNPDGYNITSALSIYAGAENKAYILTREGQIPKYALQEQKDALVAWDTAGADIKAKVPGSMLQEEIEEYNQIMGDIATYVSEYKLKFILGTESLDNFDTFRENLKNMGIERAIEIQQTMYDRFLNR